MHKTRIKFSWQRFITIIQKEFIQISRDKFSARVPIVMPVMMMLLFGYAVNSEVNKLTTAVFDQDKTQESRLYVEKFKSTGYFFIQQEVNSESEVNALIDSGKIKTALIIPTNFARDIKSNKSPTPQLIIDGSDPTVARTALSSGMSISGNYSLDLRQQFLSDKGMGELRAPGVSLNTKVRYNPNMESNRFTVPGLVGLIMQNITIMLTAFALVREKERGTIEQLIVTPIKSIELILGKMIPY
ncbi:MAG: ABC transporter permease, partial [Hyphomonadaceae bacterium]|nr:ABC transporter permease [Clostridia bacterium]